ncbi:hypothetical protein [Actinophytocola sediminis]
MTEQNGERGTDDALRTRLRAATPQDQIELLKKRFLRRARSKSAAWVDDLAELARDCAPPVIRRTISDLAWQAREVGQPLPPDAQAAPSAHVRLCRQYLHGFRLRFDFKFEALGERTPGWLRADPDDALLQAMSAFAGLGRGAPGALRALETSLASPNADGVSRNVCLHGLWFGNQVADQAERIVALSDDIIARGDDGANIYFWRAYAFRRMELFDEAMDAIDRAIELHPVGMNAVHQDYVRERSLIATSKLVLTQVAEHAQRVSADLRAELDRQLEAAKAELVKKQEDAQRTVSDSLLKIVEILGLFIALAGFLVGSGVIAFRAAGFWQNFASVALLLVGSVLFFGLLRLVIRPRRS